MDLHHRTPNRVLSRGILCGLGLALLPAASVTPAAGSNHAIPSIIETRATDSSHPLDDTNDLILFIPVTKRQWPPLSGKPVSSTVRAPVWNAPIVLDWTVDVPHESVPDSEFLLEESTDPAFANATTHVVPATSTPFSLPPKPEGTMGRYYYRVRGRNDCGSGECSKRVTILLLSQRDRFDFLETGWAPRRTSYWNLGVAHADHDLRRGMLVTHVEDRFDFAIFSPTQASPTPPHSIALRTKIMPQANKTFYGIVFGGKAGTFCELANKSCGLSLRLWNLGVLSEA